MRNWSTQQWLLTLNRLTGRQARDAFNRAYELLRTKDGRSPLTYEVVYGQAWKGAQRRAEHGTEAFIPVSQIRRPGI